MTSNPAIETLINLGMPYVTARKQLENKNIMLPYAATNDDVITIVENCPLLE
jgi:hypothetical protein